MIRSVYSSFLLTDKKSENISMGADDWVSGYGGGNLLLLLSQ